METNFADSYNQAKEQLATKLEQQAKLEQEIAQLKHFIVSLEMLLGITTGESERELIVPTGLKNACLQVLAATNRWMTASEVANFILFTGFDLSKYSNVIAPITVTLKRLVESGEARQDESSGRTIYQWKSPDEALKEVKKAQEAMKAIQKQKATSLKRTSR